MKKSIKSTLIKNSVTGVYTQIVTTLVTFILRRALIQTLGVEGVGIINTYLSVIGTLSLVDLGMDTVFLHYFFEPVSKQNVIEINALLGLLKKIYSIVGIAMLCIGLLMSLVSGHFVTNVSWTDERLRVIFIMMILSTVVTYFYSYNRVLLIAEQMQYVCMQCDLLIGLICRVMEIVLLYLTGSIYSYLLLEIIRGFMSNYFIHKASERRFPKLKAGKCDLDINKKKQIYLSIKDGFAGKIAGYVYSSTDNILISLFLETVYVGYLSNYSLLISGVKVVLNGLLNPVQAYTGKIFNENRTGEDKIVYFERYSLMVVIALAVMVLAFQSLCNIFVDIWLGAQYVLQWKYPLMLSYIFLLGIMQIPHEQVIVGAGLFRERKKIVLIGALINLTTSIAAMKVLGLIGVYIGTIASELFLWITRTGIIYNHYSKVSYMIYWKKFGSGILLVAVIDLVVAIISSKIEVHLLGSITVLIISELMVCLCLFCIYRNQSEYRFWIDLGKRLIGVVDK